MSKKDKEQIKILEQEKNLLKLTLDHYAKDNEMLKLAINDMKVTVKANKDQLNEYISKITNKDMVVEKMNNTIIQLKNRLEQFDDKVKKEKNQVNEVILTNKNQIQSIQTQPEKISEEINQVNKRDSKQNLNIVNNKECNCQIQKNKSLKLFQEKILNYKNKIQQQFDSIKNDIEIINKKINLLRDYENNKVSFLINLLFMKDLNVTNIQSDGVKINFISLLSNKEDFREFILKSNYNNTLFMTDENERIWEIVLRKDLTPKMLTINTNINSLKSFLDYSTTVYTTSFSIKKKELDEDLNINELEVSRN